MGVGMPANLYLHEFGSQVWAAFGEPPYHVGSSMTGKQWRDVDVRLILDDETYEAMGLGDPKNPHHNGKWVSLCMAYSALAKQMTGLPVDFQIQQRTQANAEFKDGPRSAIGIVELRMSKEPSVGRRCSALKEAHADDELLAVLATLASTYHYQQTGDSFDHCGDSICVRARAAIAKASK